MPKFNGRFYFKLTANGNLLGEYSNDDSSTPKCYVEAANRIGVVPDPNSSVASKLLGQYNSVWYEENAKYCGNAVLKITLARPGIYTLKWVGPEKFIGEGMLCDDILIGNYTMG